MSKVSKLKQEAYQAGKKRDWGKVIVLYERILELEKNNPALINELGDAYLKRGDVARAIGHFLDAAEKYRLTGLVNNAVAIYKKILRLDAGNMNAHWYLAESRAAQGLPAEGVEHALRFLAPCERLGSEFREAFLKRCVRMLGLFPSQPEVLSRLDEVFRFWAMPLESARVALLRACLARDAGRGERAAQDVATLLAEHPDLAATAEHDRWQAREAPPGSPAASFADHNAIDLGAAPPPRAANAATPAAPAAAPEPAPTSAGSDDGGSLEQSLGLVDFGDSAAADGGFPLDGLDRAPDAPGGLQRTGRAPLFGSSPPAPEPAPNADAAADEEGRLEIQVDDTPSFADLARELEREAEPPPQPATPVDLLAEILAEEETDRAAGEARQVDTIVSEIGQQVGGGENADPAAQYDMGLVYMEMGLLDQAAECFEAASRSPQHALRSFEMWGIALVRQERYEEAIDVMGRGLRTPGTGPHDLLGLLYHTGEAYERAGRAGAAREYYERVHQAAPDFLDIEKRLEALETV